LYGVLLKYSDKDQSHRGKYKNISNQVVAHYPDGTERIIFKTTEPHLTPFFMHDLIDRINERLFKKDIHPLLGTATFVYEFLSIHPYQDDNVCLSRLLTTLLLLRKDYKFIQYYIFRKCNRN
jgi:Fic family protein